MPPSSRRAGVLLPLFSMPSSRSWGIGEIGDLPVIARWLSDAGVRLLQLLPINEMPPGETSPYSSLSAMAIDPQFISLAEVEDIAALGGEASLDDDERARLAAVRAAPAVRYAVVRPLKEAVLRRAFARFLEVEWTARSARCRAFLSFIDAQAWWLEEYGLFRALHAHHEERSWLDWPEALRYRDPSALRDARTRLEHDIRYRQYVQWLAHEQWQSARRQIGDVQLFGDLPFLVGADSADVWSRQDEFRMDVSVGVPPDAFSETGQDWQLPAYRWDVFAARDFDWLRHRARRMVDLFDGYRIDHLVGFFRTYFRPKDGGPAQFTPADEASQAVLGERVLSAFKDAGGSVTAEDLGVVPDFVRATLARLDVPGYKVFRWERRWHAPGQPYVDPADYPRVSVAVSGTHDTETMAEWWTVTSADERAAVLDIPSVRRHLAPEAIAPARDGEFTPAVRDALLRALYAAGSDLLIVPMQDVFGWTDRVNQPATVNDVNWTWRLPWTTDQLAGRPEALDVSARLRAWGRDHTR